MALRDDLTIAASAPEVELREDERVAADLYDRNSGRSSFAAFLMGGVAVAGGLLAFLYYDSESFDQQASRDILTTNRLTQSSPSPAQSIVPSIRLSKADR